MDFLKFIEQLKVELENPLPGKDVQYEMASSFRHLLLEPDSSARESGVLLLLYLKDNTIQSVLIKRTENNDAHSGQISLPGGGYETGDKNIIHTALRETHEELGIVISKIHVLGSLTPLFIPVSNNNVFPTIGYTKEKPNFVINHNEVEYEIEFEILPLLKEGAVRSTQKEYFDTHVTIQYFDIRNHIVWGATAMMLNEFLTIVKKIIT